MGFPVRHGVWFLMMMALLTPAGSAQLPATSLDGVFPAGAAPGTTLDVTIGGSDLDDVDRLLFDREGMTAVRKIGEATPFDDGPQPVENVFVVTIAPDVPPGYYGVRCQGRYGLSNRRTFAVGTVPEVTEIEPNGGNDLPQLTESESGRTSPAQLVTLPVTIDGQSTGGPDVDWFRFEGRAGQKLFLEAECARIDSRIHPVVTLFDAEGRILAASVTRTSGEPCLSAELNSDGICFLKVHDELYSQGPGYSYRLRLAEQPQIEFIFPPCGPAGSEEEYVLYGSNLPGGHASAVELDGRLLEELPVRIRLPPETVGPLPAVYPIQPQQAGLDVVEYHLQQNGLSSNPVLLTFSAAPVIREEANDSPAAPQRLSLPCDVAGQFHPQRDADWFEFEASRGDTWVIDVLSHRLGARTDPVLLIQQVSVNDRNEQQIVEIAAVDDLPDRNFNNRSGRHEFDERSSDPTYLFTAPETGHYRILLKEASSAVRSDPRLIYHLQIRKPRPDFRIVAVPGQSSGALMLRKGGRDVIRLTVWRQDGFDGEIRITATGLPSGVTCEDTVVGPGNSYGTLVLTASDGAAGNAVPRIVATATIDGAEVVRPVRFGAAMQTFQFNQPNAQISSVPARLIPDLQVCVSETESAPQTLSIGNGTIVETARGGVVKIPWQVRTSDGAGGNLIAFPMDFPPNTNAQQVNIGGGASGEFELRFQAATIPGLYSIHLAGFNQGLQYRRNPELAEKANARQERINGIFTSAQETTRQRQQELQQRQQELTQSQNAANQANSARQQADQKQTASVAALERAEAALKQKSEQSAADPANEGLKQQVAQAQQAVTAAATARDESRKALDAAVKAAEEAATVLKAAEAARDLARTAVQDAQTFQQRAQQEKQRADQFAATKQNEAALRGYNVLVPSNSMMVRVTEFPIRVESLPESLTLKQGEKVEFAARISRLYDFQSAVSIQLQLPGGAGGIGIPGASVPDGQSESRFEITAQPGATIGEHAVNVRLQMNFNGQQLVTERPLKLIIVSATGN